MHRVNKLKLLAHARYIISTFMDKELTLFAASLSFYTIFSFIPLLLIMMISLTSLDVFSDIYLKMQELIFDNLLPVNSDVVMQYIDNFLQNSVGISILSTTLLFISSIFFYQNYEFIANRAFHAPQRVFIKSMGVYFLILIITPVALSIAFFLSTEAVVIMSYTEINISPLVPYFIIWVLFFVLFELSANIRVHFKAAFVSSFVISIVFSMAKNMFIYYVFANQSYATIYGSFSVLIFLFLWIYISWIIFIFGLKLCYLINRVYAHKYACEHKKPDKNLLVDAKN